jgi:aryl-alcohol dehydrogenase-like predicted oxidoreductase
MYTWQFAKALHTSERNGWTRFATMQNHYNLLYREEERDMLPLCADEGIGVLPWSPLARGRLTRAWDASSARAETDEMGKGLYLDEDRRIVEAVTAVSEARGVTRAQVALSWLLSRPNVVAPIVGVTKPHHLDDAIASLSLQLTPDELATLEQPYFPHPVRGIS